ncbi:MAG: hypothetical protein SPL03_09115, partial [Succinivibrio dextrinosolvens]|nr:hypothetical protein [Succinivibrio dextrinosolvens]
SSQKYFNEESARGSSWTSSKIISVSLGSMLFSASAPIAVIISFGFSVLWNSSCRDASFSKFSNR